MEPSVVDEPAPARPRGGAGPDEPAVVRALGAAVRLVNAIAIGLSGAGILVALALIGWSVVMRYAFNRPPVWVDEVVGFLLVGIVMLAAADVLRRGEHIEVDVLTGGLRGRARLWAQAWSALATLAAALILVVNGWQSAMFSRSLGIVTEGHLELPVWWLMALLPVGGLLLLLTAAEALVRLALGAPSLAEPHSLPQDAE
jgi:TRAP-type C4-dicarboxylate transport system permease small subunit